MISLKANLVFFVLISSLLFFPSYSFAQSNEDENPFSSFFEILSQIFSFEDKASNSNNEFRETATIQTSSNSSIDPEENIIPTANAGPDQTVLEFATVILDGSSSTDTDGEIISFEWSQREGPLVTLSSSTSIDPTFTAPSVNTITQLIFYLKVTDNDGDMDNDQVEVTVHNTKEEESEKDDDDNTLPLPPLVVDPAILDNNDNINNNDENNDKDHDDNNKEHKVDICHRPPGNPNNAHTISIGQSAVIAHLGHGDKLGECDDNDPNKESENRNGKSDNEKKNDKKDKSEKENSDVNNSEKKKKDKEKKDKDDDHEEETDDKKGNSGKGNSDIENPGKGNKDKNKDD
ncbi:MAG: PKD domain-containing protein [Nitrosopumilus sp.]|nr:PKD domain-containing protein [Nitrosopumilus sp.]MDH3385977.1 PKD domain-containing protein [Nitrosopumilus sp.]